MSLRTGSLFQGLLIALAFAVFAATPALAVDCERIPPANVLTCQPGADQNIARMIQSSHIASESVGNALENRFFSSDTTGESMVLNYAGEDEGLNETFANFVGTDEEVLTWNGWGDLSAAYSNRTSATVGFEGALGAFTFGGDRQIAEGTVLGAFGSAETSYYDTQSGAGAGYMRATGFGAGVYMGQLLTESLFADVQLSYRRYDNGFGVAATSATYGSQTLSAAANLTGFYQFDAWRFTPKAGVSFSREWQDGYTETSGAVSPARETDLGLATMGAEAGYTFFTGDGRTVEPWVSAALEWTFLDSTTPAPPASPDPVAALDVRLGTGVNMQLSDTATLGIRGDVSGLTTPDYLVVSGGAQLALRF